MPIELEFRRLPGDYTYYSFTELAPFQRQSQGLGDYCFVCSIPGDYSLMVPADLKITGYSEVETGWQCLAIVGEMAFSVVGVAAMVTSVLAEAGISVLVMSGYKTDYFFLKSHGMVAAIKNLRAAGHQIST